MAQNEYIPKSQMLGADSQKGPAYETEKEKSAAAGIGPASNDYLKDTYGVTDEQLGTWGQMGEPSLAEKRNDPTNGGAGADAALMSEGEYAIVQQLKADYAKAQEEYIAAQKAGDKDGMAAAQARMDKDHTETEAIRARYKYSGGTDGSMHITGLDHHYPEFSDPNSIWYGYKPGDWMNDGSGMPAAGNGAGGTGTGGASGDLKNLLDQWQSAALAQQNGKIDYAVAKAVAELERALEDAQPQFKEQAEFVDKEARQAMDNSALYAEARGDKGGIGQSQYNEIQAAAAQNHLAVQQAQTKLSTDTARQIADLRAQGEFEKADAALEIAQTYLSQLIGLEQWAAEYNLSVAQFEASLQQWQAEFDLAMQKFAVDTDLAYGQLTGVLGNGQLTLSAKKELASMGEALLSAGVMPGPDQLSAMGLTQSQAQMLMTQMQLEETADGAGVPDGPIDAATIYQQLYAAGVTNRSSVDGIVQDLIAAGVPEKDAKRIAQAYVDEKYKLLADANRLVGDTGNTGNTGNTGTSTGTAVGSTENWSQNYENARDICLRIRAAKGVKTALSELETLKGALTKEDYERLKAEIEAGYTGVGYTMDYDWEGAHA